MMWNRRRPTAAPTRPSRRLEAGVRAGMALAVAIWLVAATLSRPAAGEWWRRKTPEAGVKYGLRFVDDVGNEPVPAPLGRLRVGERHRISVALYAIRDSTLDTSAQLAAGPGGSVTVRVESSQSAVLRVEPAEAPITRGYDRATASFWLVGVRPGQARITAHAFLTDEATATVWFGPVRVEPARVAEPQRALPKPSPPPTLDSVDGDDSETASDEDESDAAPVPAPAPAAEAQAPPPSSPAPAPEPPPVTTNPTAIAAPIESGLVLPLPLREAEAAAAAPPAAANATAAAPVPVPEGVPPRPDAGDLPAAPPSELRQPVATPPAPVSMPPSVPVPTRGLFDEDEEATPPAVDTPPANTAPEDSPDGAAAPEPLERPADGPFAVADLPPQPVLFDATAAAPVEAQSSHAPAGPALPPLGARNAEPASAASAPAAPVVLPCPRFAEVLMENVTAFPLQVVVREVETDHVHVERILAGETLTYAPRLGAGVRIEAARHDGEKNAIRLLAASGEPAEAQTLPAFATEPWLEIRTRLAECPPAETD